MCLKNAFHGIYVTLCGTQVSVCRFLRNSKAIFAVFQAIYMLFMQFILLYIKKDTKIHCDSSAPTAYLYFQISKHAALRYILLMNRCKDGENRVSDSFRMLSG